jgi:hypothetical protein
MYLLVFLCAQKMMVEGTTILRRSSINACLVCLLTFFHVNWLICYGGEKQRYTCVGHTVVCGSL